MTKLSKVYFGFRRVSERRLGADASTDRDDGRLDVRLLAAGSMACSSDVLLDLGIDDDREVDDLLVIARAGDRVEERQTDALLEHAARELVGHLKVEGARHDALGFDEADEARELRSDAVVRREPRQHGLPDLGWVESGMFPHPRSVLRRLIDVIHRLIHRSNRGVKADRTSRCWNG